MPTTSLENFLIFIPFLIITVIANIAARRSAARAWAVGLLVVANLALMAVGALDALGSLLLSSVPNAPTGAILSPGMTLAIGLVILITGLVAFLPLLSGVRKFVARFLPMDPESPVHMTALAFTIYYVGYVVTGFMLLRGAQNLSSVLQPPTILDVVLNELPFFLLAVLGVGLFTRRSGTEVLQRLALRLPTWRQLLLVVGVAALLLALDFFVNNIWRAIDPAGFQAFSNQTNQFFGRLLSVPGAIVLGLAAGIAEELLFRGAIQPRFSLLGASILFAIGHLEYGLTPAVAEIFVIGLILGWVRHGTKNTTVPMLIHICYNTAGALLQLLKP